MEKLDRLGWVAGNAILAYGARIGIRTNSKDSWKELIERFPPCWGVSSRPEVRNLLSVQYPVRASRPGLRQYYLLYDGPVRVLRTLDHDEFLEGFENHLQYKVAGNSNRMFFHAGVVGWKGKAIVLPGKTLAGKTTLVAALMRAGAEYYSDEYAVADVTGKVFPYPKPLGMRESETIKQTSRTAAELGGKVGRRPIPVRAVITSTFREGAHWRARPMTSGQALLTLLQHCASAQRKPGIAVETAKQIVTGALLFRSTRGDAEETARQIIRRIEKDWT